MRMYRYLNRNGVDVSFDTFQDTYIKTRDGLYAKADVNFEEPHFNVRASETLKSLGYNYDVSRPIVVLPRRLSFAMNSSHLSSSTKMPRSFCTLCMGNISWALSLILQFPNASTNCSKPMA